MDFVTSSEQETVKSKVPSEYSRPTATDMEMKMRPK